MKHKSNYTLDRYKIRIMAKGYTHTYDIDYRKTFSIVKKLNIVCILLSLVAHYGRELE